MGFAGRLSATGLWALAGCADPPPALPSVPAPRLSADRAVAPAEPQSCGGGLLCEDWATLAGFRVPRGCVRTYLGAMVAQCSLDHLPPGGGHVREFLASRYGAVWADGPALRVQVARLGMLQILLDGNRAHFTAIAAETPLAVDTTAPQG